MLTNRLFLCNLLFLNDAFQTLQGCIRQVPNKSIEIADLEHDTTGFATKIISISPQLLVGSANAQFGKTHFFRHPVS